MTPDTGALKALIKTRCGLLIEGNGEEVLQQALTERANALAIQAASYYARVASDEAEFQELVNLLTINETYFFREPEQIRLLVDRLAPRFLAAREGLAPVRILSAGCSSGEEPYSLVMALLDRYGESVSNLFDVAGGDIDSKVLTKARNARYTEFSFRGVPASVRSRYFDKERQIYTLKPDVRNLVHFHELNLLADNQPTVLHDFDIIFFRNVSIYFDAPTRKTIQQNLVTLMKDNGVLVIGTAETLANDLGVLPLIEEDGLFYFAKGQPPLPEASLCKPRTQRTVPTWTMPPPAPMFQPTAVASTKPSLATPVISEVRPPPELASSIPPGQKPALTSARQLTHDRHYDDALSCLNAFLATAPENAEAQLLKAYVLINRKDFAAAEVLAQRVLAHDAWSVDALLLLGLAAKWQQQNKQAIGWFKQAVYTRHECWPAHYYLADLYRHSGNGEDVELARRAYRVVIQLLAGAGSAKEAEAGILHVPLDLPFGEIRFLCEHHLARLPAASARIGEH